MDENKPQLGITITEEGVWFCVWAPFASAVHVVGDFNNWADTDTALNRDERGNWSVLVPQAKVGQEYHYRITNGDTILRKNDPRALQLASSGENAVIIDTNFDWQQPALPPKALSEHVIYELHIGTFNRIDATTDGTFETAMQKLDYLQDLGITAIELMPITKASVDRWWGYTPTFIYAVENVYGGLKAFMRFVDAAHARGIAVILDVIYNHLNPDRPTDMWQFDGWHENNRGGIYFYNDPRGDTPWGDRLDYGRSEVRQYITDNVAFWLKTCNVDGLRVDATGYIRTLNGHNNNPADDIPDGWKMLQEITTTAKNIKPSSILIAEDIAANEYVTKPVAECGAGFDAQWETSFPYALRDTLLDTHRDEDRNLENLKSALFHIYNGQPLQRVIFSESHDIDANTRARMSEEIEPGNTASVFAKKRTAMAAAVVLTAPGIPMLLQGQEFMENGSFSHWQPLDWQKTTTFHGMVQLYKDLITVRLHNPGLQGKELTVTHLNNATKVLAYCRKQGDHETMVVFNFTNASLQNYELEFSSAGAWQTIFNSDWEGYSHDFSNTPTAAIQASKEKHTCSLTIGPYTVLILTKA